MRHEFYKKNTDTDCSHSEVGYDTEFVFINEAAENVTWDPEKN